MPTWLVICLVGVNLGLIFLLLAAPIGVRTLRRSVSVAASPERIWKALWPLGSDAGWSGEIVKAEALGHDQARLALSWEGRDGSPISRLVRFDAVRPGSCFSMTVQDDSSLDASFWRDFREDVSLCEDGAGQTRVTIVQQDRYRGLAFLVFRHFALRRRLAKLDIWARTGAYRSGGVFERPLTQFGMAVLSVLILWPLAGLTAGGLAFAVMLTTVVALHELGHMAAFRITGHRSARMIFIPLLGGIAIGGRPYDSHFEVAFVALMGAGFSAFLVPPLMAASAALGAGGNIHGANFFAAIVGCVALFNLANLVPVWKFDGGQVLRQILSGGALAAGSFALLVFFLATAYIAGFPIQVVAVAGIVLATLSVITSGSGVKPRHALRPAGLRDRLALAAALMAVIAIHATGVRWAFSALA